MVVLLNKLVLYLKVSDNFFFVLEVNKFKLNLVIEVWFFMSFICFLDSWRNFCFVFCKVNIVWNIGEWFVFCLGFMDFIIFLNGMFWYLYVFSVFFFICDKSFWNVGFLLKLVW